MWPPPSALSVLPLVDLVLNTERIVEMQGYVTGNVSFYGVQGHLGSEPDKVKSFYWPFALLRGVAGSLAP